MLLASEREREKRQHNKGIYLGFLYSDSLPGWLFAVVGLKETAASLYFSLNLYYPKNQCSLRM